ncbi:hypothetical protein VTL71DRAFT_15562 [Oculimacula yallundae]|uniref:Cytochrome b5 heme-binding domain-containing protein n=1 Tax=Oculimacula yallundae TaxID=86028 RepID=A0ABR4CHJ5_9HELO
MGSITPLNREIITIEKLAEHGTLNSLWIAVHDQVYDLTTFSTDHPGGIDALESSAGTDGTEAYEYAGHSEENMARMQQYCVGNLEGGVTHQHFLAAEAQRTTSVGMDRGIKGTVSKLGKMNTAGNKLVATVIATSSIVVVLTRFYLPSSLESSRGQFMTMSIGKLWWVFGAGTAVTCVFSLAAFRYLYLLFLSSLDYQNDVFSFPPTIPRRTRR